MYLEVLGFKTFCSLLTTEGCLKLLWPQKLPCDPCVARAGGCFHTLSSVSSHRPTLLDQEAHTTRGEVSLSPRFSLSEGKGLKKKKNLPKKNVLSPFWQSSCSPSSILRVSDSK